jgi:hypothetical protein
MSSTTTEQSGAGASSAVELADRRFGEQLMADALYLRAFIAARGLYSKEVLDANKALMTSIEKAEASAGALTAETENSLLEAMGNVLRHLKCNTIEDLRRAESPSFRSALLLGRVVVFTAMFMCIIVALPLTLAFNQLTQLTTDITGALNKDALAKYMSNRTKFDQALDEYQHLTSLRNSQDGSTASEAGAPGGPDSLDVAVNGWAPGEVTSRIAALDEQLGLLQLELELQQAALEDLGSLSPILRPLFILMDSVKDYLDTRRVSTSADENDPNTSAATKTYYGNEMVALKQNLTPIRRNSEALAFLLNQGVLPLLYGMLGAAVFLSRRYMSTSSELWASNPLADALMRIGLGGMAGLIVGWFQTPDVSKLTTTPFALAFVAGFSIDIVFSLLERIVAAFDFRKAA